MSRNFSEEQLKTIEDLVVWVLLLKEEPGFTNRLKIWRSLKDDGADGCLILEAFRRTGLIHA